MPAFRLMISALVEAIVMTFLLLAILVAGPPAQPGQQPAATIVVCPMYQSAIDAMLRYSPTFQRQYSRLLRAQDLRVEIAPSLLGGRASDGALTRIVRRGGGIEADVQLGASGDPVLLIAHEFEHILEQLDGVDLPAMATRAATGVRLLSGSGHFETDRAIATGRQVANEVRRGRARDGT
jgi:hypothetical protein